MPQRIILTVTNDLVYDQRMQRICGSLSRAGYEVWLVGRLRPQSPTLAPADWRQVRLRCYFESGKLFYLEYNLRLLFFLLTHSFAAASAVDLDTLLPCFVAARLKRKPCLYDAHEYFTEVPEVVRRPLVKKIWEWLARLLIPRVDAAYTVGEGLGKLLSQRYGKPFAIVRNVPEKEQGGDRKVAQSHSRTVLYQGALNEGRGLEQAIEAMQYLPDVSLWLAGEGDLSDSLRQLSRRLGLEDRVHFLGFVRPDELKKLTLQATIGLNLLENKGLSYYYSLANKAFDYIRAGVPSIHMDFPEYRVLNDQYDVFELLDELTPYTIFTTIQRLLSDSVVYQRLQTNCGKAGEILTWEREESILLRIYSDLLG
ncbi:MAG: glycosyltransferase [Saprospiraceae bacterium]|nr:glycosyltransferase [Saprospiraceae bacterium]